MKVIEENELLKLIKTGKALHQLECKILDGEIYDHLRIVKIVAKLSDSIYTIVDNVQDSKTIEYSDSIGGELSSNNIEAVQS